MDRREFVRRMLIIGVMAVAGAGGTYALAQKILSAPANTPLLNGQSPTSISTISAAPDTVTVTVTTTESSAGSGSGNNSTSSSTTTNANSSPPAGYILLASLSAVAGKSYAYFNHPKFGTSILVNYNGAWKAFSAICTHAGCTVDYSSSELICPCHNGYFSAVNGGVLGGPPPRPLPEYGIQVANGNIYVGNSLIN